MAQESLDSLMLIFSEYKLASKMDIDDVSHIRLVEN